MSDKNQEEVLVTVNAPDMHPINENTPYDFTDDYLHLGPFGEDWKNLVIDNASFVPRWLAEKDDTTIQLIPYIFCCAEGDDGILRFLTYRRKGGGEGRLEGKKSIGIGGHINISDSIQTSDGDVYISWDTVLSGAVREVLEELNLTPDDVEGKLEEIGVMYTPNDGVLDTDNRKASSIPPVGAVHIALVYILPIPPDTTIRDNEGMINPELKRVTEIYEELEEYEFWSQLIIEALASMKKENNKP